MEIGRRIFLFVVVNALILLTVNLLAAVFGVNYYLTSHGIDYRLLSIMCLLYGSVSSFISLLLSRWIAKSQLGVQLIDPNTNDPTLRFLVQTVYELARQAGMKTMPEVGIYDSADLNAFATGPSSSMALVAVTTGLLSRMDRDEITGVLAHEITHITNGDMVTMALLQGIVNSFVMFLSRVIAYAVTTLGRDEDDRGPGIAFYVVQGILDVVFMFFGSMVVAWFSRWREYRADAGGAKLAGKARMIGALEELKRTYEPMVSAQASSVQLLQINGHPSGLMKLFASHPPLEERIERLRKQS